MTERVRSFVFTLKGRVVPCVRMTQRSKHVSVQAQRYLAYKDAVGYAAKEAGATPWDGPIRLNVGVVAHRRKWDASNVLKGVEDALNHICWHDDKQIVKATISVKDEGNAGEDQLWVEVIAGVTITIERVEE